MSQAYKQILSYLSWISIKLEYAYQNGMTESPDSMPTGGNILLLILLFSCSKASHANIANFV